MYYQATTLDLLEAIHMNTHQPVMYLKLRVEPALDVKRLQHVLAQCIEKIPELAAFYHRRKNRFEPFENKTKVMEGLITEVLTMDFTSWDLEKEAQIKIQINQQDPCEIGIGISHILCDGIGACQLIRLLCACYNGEACFDQNQRALAELPTKKVKRKAAHRTKGIPPLLKESPDPQETIVLRQSIPLSHLQRMARLQQISINDLLMGSYCYSLSRLTGQQAITLPCPVNLRAFLNDAPALSVANFTGGYEVTITDLQQKSWEMINQEVHLILQKERIRNEDLHLISMINPISKWLPVGMLRILAKKFYQIPPISYTNLGRLDPYLCLLQHQVKEAMIITSPRIYPAYQVSVSSYQDICTLTLHIKGNPHHIQQAQLLLHHIIEELHRHTTIS